MSKLNPAIKSLEWLLGTWRCEKTEGFYPTIKNFFYGEELKFESVGQPMLNYSSRFYLFIYLFCNFQI